MADPTTRLDVLPQLDNITKLATSMRDGVLGAREDLVVAARSLLNEVESPTERIWRLLWAEVSHQFAKHQVALLTPVVASPPYLY